MGVGDTFDYKAVKEAIREIIESRDFKVILIDEEGNVISDSRLSDIFGSLEALKGALQSVDEDKLLMVISEDGVGLAKDETLRKITDALLSVNADKLVVDIGRDDVGLTKDETMKLSGQSGFAVELTIPSGKTFQIPEGKEVIVSSFLAEGDLYAEGDLLVL